MKQPIDVVSIQTGSFHFRKQAIIAPRNEQGDILQDACPKETVDIITFGTVKGAAQYMHVSETTVRRQLKAYQDND